MNESTNGDFTKVKSMSFPREILAGHDVVSKIGEMCVKFELSGRALIVTGEKTGAIAGTLVEKLLREGGYESSTVVLSEASRANVDTCKKSALDGRAHFLVGVGGGSKNRLWNQIRADVLNRPLRLVDRKETTVLGAACFALPATGAFRDAREARAAARIAPLLLEPGPEASCYADVDPTP